MKSKNSIKSFVSRSFLVLWASAIIWFYVGNLINFHQNLIWGKQLIPACFTYSAANRKDFAALQKGVHRITPKEPGMLSTTVLGNEYNPIHVIEHSLSTNPILKQRDLITAPGAPVVGLRAPPVA